MNKISRAASDACAKQELRLGETVKNFMDGDSYVVNPLDTLKMITASSIFGEPSYYRDSKLSGNRYVHRQAYSVHDLLEGFSVLPAACVGKTTEDIMESAIDAALDYNFEGTLKWAAELRKEYFIRLNPQVIIARAAMHPKRAEFTSKMPEGTFRKMALDCMTRADDCLNGMAYYLYKNGSKAKMPSVLKRSYADSLSGLNAYSVNKYKSAGIGMINGVRISHANSPVLNELMRTGTVQVEADSKTWETLRSAGKSWAEIFSSIKMGHMAMLRNLRGFFSEVDDREIGRKYLEQLKAGVHGGKQLPFRYYSAYKAITDCNDQLFNKQEILDTLEDCMDIALDNMPRIKGKTAALSDNSGSAWGAIPSEYGSVTIAEIDNLSAVIIAACSDEGYVYKFGDTFRVFPISKRTGILKQAMEISKNSYQDVGGNTEGGIWKFMHESIQNRTHWDNIFIFSDQQAGHGGLYGTYEDKALYRKLGFSTGDMVNVFKLVLEYRKEVFKRVNVFSVQTAGYDNSVLPEYAYRTNLLYGWTGREAQFADIMIHQWDAIEKHNQQ